MVVQVIVLFGDYVYFIHTTVDLGRRQDTGSHHELI